MTTRAEADPAWSTTHDELTEFILSLVQAFLRTGYYLPEHPQAKMAKAGLYGRFRSLFRGRHELTFMLQEEGEILVDGPLPETQKLSKMMTRGMAEVYVPRLAKFLDRKELISLTLKERMAEDEFSRFIDVMSEPSFMTLDEAGKSLFTERLRDNNITHISVVFNEDLIQSSRNLPWRVQMSISRLRKDLRSIPMFQNLDAAEFHALRRQIIEDVLRPVTRPDVLASLLLNSDLARTSEIEENELEEEIVSLISEPLLADTGHEAISLHFASAEGRDPEERRRVLVRLYGRLRSSEAPGVEQVLREYLDRMLIEFDDLPETLRRQINIERETDEYLKNPPAMLRFLDEAASEEPYRLQGEKLLRITGELLRRNALDETRALVDVFRRHTSMKGFQAPIAAGFFQTIAAGPIGACLRERFLHSKKEERLTLGAIFRGLGTYGQRLLLAIVRKTNDTWIRKNACEILLRSGGEAEGLLLEALTGGEFSPSAVPEVLLVLGETDKPSAKAVRVIKKHLEQKNPKIREEAAWALCKIRGKVEENTFLYLLQDPDINVRKRVIRCLRLIRSERALAPMVGILRAAREKADLDPLAIHIILALADFPGIELEPGIDAEQLLVNLLKEAYPSGLRAILRLGSQPQLSDGAMRAICDTLGAIGTERSRALLENLAKRALEETGTLIERTLEAIDRRRREPELQKKEGQKTLTVKNSSPDDAGT